MTWRFPFVTRRCIDLGVARGLFFPTQTRASRGERGDERGRGADVDLQKPLSRMKSRLATRTMGMPSGWWEEVSVRCRRKT